MNRMTTQWRLSAWYFVYFAFIGAFQPYFSLYLETQNLDAARIALLMSLGQAMRLLAPIAWGWLSDYSGRRTPVVRASAVLSVLSFSGYFFTQDFLLLLLVTAFLHCFWSASLPLVEALTFAHLRDAPERYGRIRLWGSIGFVIAVFGVGVWLDHRPIASLLPIAWGILLLVMAAAWTLDELPHVVEAVKRDLAPCRIEPRVVALLVAGFFMSAAHGALYVFYSIHLVDNGYDKALVGLLWSLGVVAEILVFIYLPRMTNHFRLRQLLLICLVLAFIRFLLIGWCVDVLALLVVAQLLHGATFGAHHVASVAALNHWFPHHQQGRVQALYGSLSFGGGGMLGGLLAGLTWQTVGAAISFSIASGFALIGLIVVYFFFTSEAVVTPME